MLGRARLCQAEHFGSWDTRPPVFLLPLGFILPIRCTGFQYLIPFKEILVGFYPFDYIHSRASEEEMCWRGIFIMLEE